MNIEENHLAVVVTGVMEIRDEEKIKLGSMALVESMAAIGAPCVVGACQTLRLSPAAGTDFFCDGSG